MTTWEARWQAGDTPWDLGGSPPALVSLVASGAVPTGRALVPGCGAGWDAFTLCAADRAVVGLDVSPSTRAVFEAERDRRGLTSTQARIEIGDFFSWSPQQPFHLVWDHTFLCALPPARRDDWAARMHDLLRPGGQLLTLVYPVREPQWPPRESDPDEGPPFPVHPDVYRRHLAAGFDELELVPVAERTPGRECAEWLGRWRRR